jgi:hypothetical protein
MSGSLVLTPLLLVIYFFAGFKFDATSSLRDNILSDGFRDVAFATELTSVVLYGETEFIAVAKESLRCWLLPKTFSDLLRLIGTAGLTRDDPCTVDLWETGKLA